jgi:ferritin-like metal-binding protein YciE
MGDKGMYMGWLNDAYARELTGITALEQHIQDAAGLHELSEELKFRLAIARSHADLMRSCLDRLLASPVMTKLPHVDADATHKATLADETASQHDGSASLVRNTIDDIVATTKGVAAYTSLAIAAGSMGDAETARICHLIQAEEEYGADLIRRQLSVVTHVALRDGVHASAAL